MEFVLYQLLKEKKIDWNFFSAAEINRLDLNYLRKIHPSQADFFKQSEETIRAKGINARINSTNVFFADKGDEDSTFHTGMNLNEGQIDDLKDNNNIL